MQTIEDIMAIAGVRARERDIVGAIELLGAGSKQYPSSSQILEFRGYLAASSGNHAVAIEAYAALLELDAENMAARVNLATALTAQGRLDEATAVATGYDHPQLARVVAYAEQQRDPRAAIRTYEKIVEADPTDAESLNNLGNALMANGELDAALVAFDRAVQARPEAIDIYFNFSNALFLADRPEARRQLMQQAAEFLPDDAQVQLELGLAEAARGDMIAAERALRQSIALDRKFSRAFVELGLLLENLNRIDDLSALIDEARARDAEAPELQFLEAWLLRRQGKVAEALTLAERVPENIHPLRRFQLIADLRDRLGDADGAFAKFTEMNQAAIGVQRPLAGPTYLQLLQGIAANLDDERAPIEPSGQSDDPSRAPIFIVGFPRSGTTLLDTLLLNVPGVHVLEELPALNEATAALGQDEAGLAAVNDVQAAALREAYLARVEALSPGAAGQIIIDKHPLHMTRLATIHRLFPQARIVLVERHPCDAVLSCFMANFQLNTAMRSFTTLEETARVYDAAFTIFERALSRFPDIKLIRVRYERMIADLEGEMRPLLAALGLPWVEAVLDNRKAAANRERVRTASYAQITEPLYQRAVARWERYRQHLAPVLPILEPWVRRMGYLT